MHLKRVKKYHTSCNTHKLDTHNRQIYTHTQCTRKMNRLSYTHIQQSDRQTDRQIDRHRNTHTHTHTIQQSDRQTDRQIDRHRNTHTHNTQQTSSAVKPNFTAKEALDCGDTDTTTTLALSVCPFCIIS